MPKVNWSRVPDAEDTVTWRLEYIRQDKGYSNIRDFWRALMERIPEGDPYKVSYEAVRYYHGGRDAPVDYLVHVADAFGFRIEWLATGRGEPTLAGMVVRNMARTAPRGTPDPLTDPIGHMRVSVRKDSELVAEMDVAGNVFRRKIPFFDRLSIFAQREVWRAWHLARDVSLAQKEDLGSAQARARELAGRVSRVVMAVFDEFGIDKNPSPMGSYVSSSLDRGTLDMHVDFAARSIVRLLEEAEDPIVDAAGRTTSDVLIRTALDHAELAADEGDVPREVELFLESIGQAGLLRFNPINGHVELVRQGGNKVIDLESKMKKVGVEDEWIEELRSATLSRISDEVAKERED